MHESPSLQLLHPMSCHWRCATFPPSNRATSVSEETRPRSLPPTMAPEGRSIQSDVGVEFIGVSRS
eukprot:31182-Pelagococcus_subviridis.AAC.6